MTVLSVKQYLERSQEPDNENCKHQQQKELQAEVRSSVLQEFPHLKTRHDKAIVECMLNMNNIIKCVNEFFELSNDMLNNNYLDHPHTVNDSPCQDIITSRKLENSSPNIFVTSACSNSTF